MELPPLADSVELPIKRPRGRPRKAIADGDIAPKRKRGRPRKHDVVVTKPRKDFKYVTMNKVMLNVPSLPIVWRARKQLWLIRNIEEHLKKDPLAISAKEYFYIIKEQEQIYVELAKKGLETHEKRTTARHRAYEKRVGEAGGDVSAPTVGEGESASVGDGVSAPNPFGK